VLYGDDLLRRRSGDESRDEIQWMELHGLKIDYVESDGDQEYYFTIPQRCNALQETKGDDGLARYTCGVYETRPQMCRDYDGSIAGPLGVEDCFWRLEKEGKPLPLTNLVQLETFGVSCSLLLSGARVHILVNLMVDLKSI